MSPAVRAKPFVFTGQLLSARTGQPHPNVGALDVEVLSRARTPARPGCHAADPFERRDRPVVERSGPGRFAVRVPASSGACAYQPLNVRFRLVGQPQLSSDDGVKYVINDDGTLNIQERPWALVAASNKEEFEVYLQDVGVIRRGTDLVLAYLEPRYVDLQALVGATHDSRAARFYTRDAAVRSVYWELFFQRRGPMLPPPDRLPAVEIVVEGDHVLAWTSPVQWQRHPQPGRLWYGAGVTDPWAWLVEGQVRREGDTWKIDLASVPLGPRPAGAAPRFAPTAPFFSAAAAALVEEASEGALLEQARSALIEAGQADGREYDFLPREIQHKGLGRLSEVTGDVVVSGSMATLRLRGASEDRTSAHTYRLEVNASDRRVILDHPRLIAFETWTMSDRTWGDRICRDRSTSGQPFVFDWMTKQISARGGRTEDLSRCDPTDVGGCRLGVEGGRTWYGRCWWDPAAQDLLLGPRPLAVRRARYWTVAPEGNAPPSP